MLGSKSSSLGGGCGLAKDKSFEELRFEHLQENPNGCPLTLENAKSSCLPQQLLWILGRVLDCEPIRPTVVNLVSVWRSQILLVLKKKLVEMMTN